MSEFNLIQRPDLVLRIQQMLGLRQAHVTPSLSETVQPVVIMGDVRDTGGERQIVRPAWGFDSQGPVAAQFSNVLLLTPLPRRTIVTVREVRVSNPTAAGAQQFSMFLRGPGINNPSGALAAFPPKFRHSRAIDPQSNGAVNIPSGILSHGTLLAPEPTAFVLKSPGTAEVVSENEIVLAPGWELLVQNDVANQAITASFLWEEEDLEQRA